MQGSENAGEEFQKTGRDVTDLKPAQWPEEFAGNWQHREGKNHRSAVIWADHPRC
jgi:hypothetical protein